MTNVSAGLAGWHSGRPYSHFRRVRDLVFIAGQVPVDPVTGATAGDDIHAQTAAVLDGLTRSLAAAGATVDSVASVRVFLTRIADIDGMDEIYRGYFSEPYPVRTTVEVSKLGRAEFLVEVDAIAVSSPIGESEDASR